MPRGSDDWFADNAPSGGGRAEQIQQVFRQYLGRDATDVSPWLNDPNFEENIRGSQEAKNFAARPRQAAPGVNAGGVQAFIQQWQQTHPASEGIGPLADALKAAGYGNVSRFQYGNTPSNNELSIDGQKFKVLSGENSSNPSWYTAGTDDSGGGGGGEGFGGAGGPFIPPPEWSEKFAGPTQAELEGDVGYQEQLKRGQQAIERSAAARGTVLNPGTLKDLSEFSQGTAASEMDKLYGRKAQEYQQRYKQYLDNYGLASQTFGTNYNVWNNDANRFVNAQDRAFQNQLSLAQLGLQGAGQVTGAGGNYANQGGQNITGAGDAAAAGIVGGANAYNQALGNIGNTATSLYAMNQANRRPFGGYGGNY